MAWFLRAIEEDDGRWRCQFGMTTYDVHDHLPDALRHLGTVAASLDTAELFIHHSDGTVHSLGGFEPDEAGCTGP